MLDGPSNVVQQTISGYSGSGSTSVSADAIPGLHPTMEHSVLKRERVVAEAVRVKSLPLCQIFALCQTRPHPHQKNNKNETSMTSVLTFGHSIPR